MDISIVGKNSIRFKGRQAAFVVDPEKGMPKTNADAILLLNGFEGIDEERVSDSRITISGAGDYEIGGVKISGVKTAKGILYKFLIDDVVVVVGKSADVKTEGFSTCQIAVVNSDEDFKDSFITALEPSIAIFYGDKKEDAAKEIGAENITKTSKVSATKDKLPDKMEVVVLG